MNKQLFAICFASVAAFAVLTGGCQNAATNTANTNAAANANTAVVSEPSPTASPTVAVTSQTIETNEPEEYSAVLELNAQTTGGERASTIQPLVAEVAREGARRRASFNLPNNEKVIYLNRGDARYLILPNRNQYAELKPESLGFNLPRLMMPDQIVDYLRNLRGYERVGEEQLNGRAVIKYRAAGTTQTNTQAGAVQAETFVYVDKETGLPLRAELASQASGNVQGVQGLNAIIVMRDINRDVDSTLFEVPNGLNKISDEQVRAQITALANAAGAVLGTLLNNQNASPTSVPSPVNR